MYFTSMDLSDDTIAVHVYSTCLEVSIIAVSFTIPFICPVYALGPLGGVLGWCCLFVHGLLYFTYIKRVVYIHAAWRTIVSGPARGLAAPA